MSTYRIYSIDDTGRVLAESSPFLAADDESARRRAEAEAEGDHVELRCGPRMVAIINPKPTPRLTA